MKRAIILPALVTAFVALSPVGVALAAPNPSGTGQPNQDVDAQPFRPHGFLTGGFATADGPRCRRGAACSTDPRAWVKGENHVVVP